MKLLRLYLRVLSELGPDRRLGWFLAGGNVALALAQFAEPVLFGRVVNALTAAQGKTAAANWADLKVLLIAWVGVRPVHHPRRLAGGALFRPPRASPPAGGADQIFRARAAPAAAFFGDTHSGRLMKMMLQGTDALWALWLGFFREHMAAFVSLAVLLPLSLAINWRLALLLMALCPRLCRA